MASRAIKVLWLCPNLNHYKYKFLNYLNTRSEVEITILKGLGRESSGDIKMSLDFPIKIIEANVYKKYFGFSNKVRKIIKDTFRKYDYVMIPRERKNIVLILFFNIIKMNGKTKLFSYNHPFSYSGYKHSYFDRIITKILHMLYDKIIFYTKQSMETALALRLIYPKKAYFANNTIFTKEVDKVYKFSIPSLDNYKILFIGRLIENKNLKILFEYYFELKNMMQEKNKIIELDIIGDGPLRDLVVENVKKDSNIKWLGALESETEIKKHIIKANLVFNPGHSGLHIAHSFCYGRPYVTIYWPNHAPEIDYLKNGYNGYILQGNKVSDLKKLFYIILNSDGKIYQNAYKTGKELSIENWCEQIIHALKA